VIVAHGVGSSADLPLPLDLVLQAGAATVVLSFLISAFWWRRARLDVFSSRPPRLSRLRYPVLALTLYLVVNAFAGPPADTNPAGHALFVWLWVGLIPVSVVFGPVWRVVNPLRTLHDLLLMTVRRLPRRGLRPLPPGRGAGMWPAAGFLLGFVWFELIVQHPVGAFFLLYGAVHLTCAVVRGEEWFARADCFEVYSDLAGRLSPLAWRPWLSGLAVTPLPAAFLAVWWGSTVFDSASASPAWATLVQRLGQPALLSTVAVVSTCGFVYVAVRWAAGRLNVTGSLIPIAAGYTMAHYLTLLLVEGPRGVQLLLGLAPDWNPVLNPELIAALQIALILIGHALGVVVAHDRALADSPNRPMLATVAEELPMVLFMIACTWTGLFLLFVR
jgi:hypothetical protein